ncbi:TPA: hypothetical protein ACX6QK_001268 [Photobacterium damselae]
MKKTIIAASVILSTLSVSAVAAVTPPTSGAKDTTSATLTWKAKVPTVVPGAWITFTGAAGGAVSDGTLKIEPTGSFTSSPIDLELREYDSSTATAGDLLGATVSGVNVKTVNYVVESLAFTSSDAAHDLTGIKGQITEESGNINAGMSAGDAVTLGNPMTVDSLAGSTTKWAVKNGPGEGITKVTAGEEITASAIVRADVEFG